MIRRLLCLLELHRYRVQLVGNDDYATHLLACTGCGRWA